MANNEQKVILGPINAKPNAVALGGEQRLALARNNPEVNTRVEACCRALERVLAEHKCYIAGKVRVLPRLD